MRRQEIFILVLTCKIRQRRQQGGVKKAVDLISKTKTEHVQQTFFVHFFAVAARLRRENAYFHVLWRT